MLEEIREPSAIPENAFGEEDAITRGGMTVWLAKLTREESRS